MKSIKNAFTKQYLSRLEQLPFNGSHRGVAGMQGKRKSLLKGNSLEFSDFKNYTAGDDLRRVDWNSYARSGKIFVKLFMEERRSNFNIFIDSSSSMSFYEKDYFSRVLAGSLAYMALANYDGASVYSIGGVSQKAFDNLSSRQSFTVLLDFLDGLTCQGNQGMREGVGRTTLRGGVSIIISDMLNSDGHAEMIDYLRSRKQDVIVFHVMGEEELKPEVSGQVRLQDSEDGSFIDLEITPAIMQKYLDNLTRFKNGILKLCQSRGANYIFAPTGCNMLQIIASI